LPLLQEIIQLAKPFLIPQSHKLIVCGKRYCTVLIKYTIGVLCILAFLNNVLGTGKNKVGPTNKQTNLQLDSQN
jgi:hypothetical protein